MKKKPNENNQKIKNLLRITQHSSKTTKTTKNDYQIRQSSLDTTKTSKQTKLLLKQQQTKLLLKQQKINENANLSSQKQKYTFESLKKLAVGSSKSNESQFQNCRQKAVIYLTKTRNFTL